MTAAKTALPVLGVPVESKALAGHGLAALDRADARRHPGRHARDRPGRRGERRAARRRDRGADGRGRRASACARFRARRQQPCSTPPIPPRSRARARSSASARVTLVACIGGGQLGRMLALAGDPARRRASGSSTRRPTPAPVRSASCSSAHYDDAERCDALADGAARRHLRVRERAGRRRRARRRGARRPRALARRAGPAAREGAVPPPRHPDRRASATLADTGPARAAQDARGSATTARGSGASTRAEPLARRTSWPRSSSPFDRELSIVGVRGRDGDTRFWPLVENVHRDGILAVSRARRPRARRRRRPRRSPGACSTRSTTSACSRSSCSTPTAACSPTSSRRACTTRATGRSTAPRRASSRTTCARSSGCRSARPTRSRPR